MSVHEYTHFSRDPAFGDLELLHANYVTHTFAPHTHEGFAIGVVEHGAETFRYRKTIHFASAGEIILINPGDRSMTTRRLEFFTGIKDELPILPGVIPFGMIYGVSALSAHIPAVVAQAMSCIVFAGSSQFIIAQLVALGTPPVVVILTAFIVNIRHMLYSASLAPFVKRLPTRWKWLLAYLLTDEAYVVTISHYRKSEDETYTHWYFFGAGLALWTTWQISTAIGIFLGTQVPASWSLDFTSTLTFIALVVPALKDRASMAAALTAGIVAIIVYGLPFKLGLGLATMIGILVGVWIETLRQCKNTHCLRSTP